MQLRQKKIFNDLGPKLEIGGRNFRDCFSESGLASISSYLSKKFRGNLAKVHWPDSLTFYARNLLLYLRVKVFFSGQNFDLKS